MNIKWLKDLFTDGTNVSSKRVFGAIGFLSGIVLVFMATLKVKLELVSIPQEAINTVIITSASLLGLDTIRKMIPTNNNSK